MSDASSEPAGLSPQLQRISSCIEALVCLEEPERADRVAAFARSEDPAERRAAELYSEAKLDQFLQRPAADHFPKLAEDLAAQGSAVKADFLGTQIGVWQLDRLIASGGMGDVYLASRADGQYVQQVALKRMSFVLGASRARFVRERQVLAQLEHPNIARLIDGGVTEDGMPYLIAELVEGRRLDAYVGEEGLGVRATLSLFLQVCDAVEFAHSRWIVHRDLKPANILVSEADQEPRVKLLDFGVASLIGGADESDEAQAPMTPAYAAPEQLSNQSTDQRTDVYSLGVVLYELLAGTRPLAPAVSGAAVACEYEPSEPLSPQPVLVSAAAAEAGRQHSRRLAGDMDAILARALQRSAEARYPSVAAFASDIRRHLDGLPVSVRASEVSYRWRRWLRRRWAIVAVALLVATTAVASGVVLVERVRAEAQARERSDQIVAFLRETLAPERLAQPEARTAALLAPAIGEAGRRFVADPALEAAVLGTLGGMLSNQEEYALARTALERAIELEREELPQTADALTRNLVELGWVAANEGEVEEAILRFDEAQSVASAHLGERSEASATIGHQLGLFEIRSLPYDHPRRAQGQGHLKQSLDLHRDLFGSEHPRTASVWLDWGLSLEDEPTERFFELERALALHRSIAPGGSAELAQALADVALVHEGAGNVEDAIALGWEAKEVFDRVGPLGSSLRLDIVNNLAGLLRDQGAYGEAEPLYREVLTYRRRLNSADATTIAYPLYGLGRVESALGKCDRAVPHLEEAAGLLDIEKRPIASALVRFALGECIARQQGFAAAETKLIESIHLLEQSLPADHHDLRSTKDRFQALQQEGESR